MIGVTKSFNLKCESPTSLCYDCLGNSSCDCLVIYFSPSFLTIQPLLLSYVLTPYLKVIMVKDPAPDNQVKCYQHFQTNVLMQLPSRKDFMWVIFWHEFLFAPMFLQYERFKLICFVVLKGTAFLSTAIFYQTQPCCTYPTI